MIYSGEDGEKRRWGEDGIQGEEDGKGRKIRKKGWMDIYGEEKKTERDAVEGRNRKEEREKKGRRGEGERGREWGERSRFPLLMFEDLTAKVTHFAHINLRAASPSISGRVDNPDARPEGRKETLNAKPMWHISPPLRVRTKPPVLLQHKASFSSFFASVPASYLHGFWVKVHRFRVVLTNARLTSD